MDSVWPERIIVGVDDSPEASAALGRALDLAARAGSSVVPVHARGLLEGAHVTPTFDVDGAVARANATARCPDSLIAAAHIVPGHAPDVILRVTEELGGDLVVVGRRGAGVTARALGSTSEALLTAARVPVLIAVAP